MKYPLEFSEQKLGNLKIRLIGVAHTPSYFLEHEKSFRQEINSTDHVFFEDSILFNSWGNKFEKMLGIDHFYETLAELVKKRNMPIYVPDNNSFAILFSDLITFGIGTYMLVKPVYSRRNFLIKGSMALGGLYLASGFQGLREGLLQGLIDPEETLDNQIAYNANVDFRNIISAENLGRMERDLSLSGTATYFVGNGHVEGISAYLRNPKMRRKRILYLPQDLAIDDTIKEYRNIDDEWKIVRRV